MGNINNKYFKNYIYIDKVNTNIISKINYIPENQHLIVYINKILNYIKNIYYTNLDNVYIIISKNFDRDTMFYKLLIKYNNILYQYKIYYFSNGLYGSHNSKYFHINKFISFNNFRIHRVNNSFSKKIKNKKIIERGKDCITQYKLYKNYTKSGNIITIKKEKYHIDNDFSICYFYNKNIYYCKTYHYYINNYLIYIHPCIDNLYYSNINKYFGSFCKIYIIIYY